jgi:hypothetical protein
LKCGVSLSRPGFHHGIQLVTEQFAWIACGNAQAAPQFNIHRLDAARRADERTRPSGIPRVATFKRLLNRPDAAPCHKLLSRTSMASRNRHLVTDDAKWLRRRSARKAWNEVHCQLSVSLGAASLSLLHAIHFARLVLHRAVFETFPGISWPAWLMLVTRIELTTCEVPSARRP